MKLLTVLIALTLTSTAFANEDGAFLDAPYTHQVKIKKMKDRNKGLGANDVESVIEVMTPVRSQVSRGTCSIFSATAILEGMLRFHYEFDTTLDLSEEYLEFLVVTGSSDGSSSWTNFPAIYSNGLPAETTVPYIGEDWSKTPFLSLAQQRCGHLDEYKKKNCLIVHRDRVLLTMSDDQILGLEEGNPLRDEEFVNGRKEAAELRGNYLTYSPMGRRPNFSLYNESTIRKILDSGRPVTMGIDFYYGAWNHRKADEYGIGRDNVNWSKGIVGYPERGSVDRTVSPQHRAGHSILIVGYDDNKVVETTVKMNDGSTKTFRYQGVYYFKNSWGTGSFGAQTDINGKNYPGYGMITMKYANEMGSFYHMPDSMFK